MTEASAAPRSGAATCDAFVPFVPMDSTSSLVPSSLRPVPLRARADLIARLIEFRGERTWIVKDPVGLKYHRLMKEQYAILHLLDGRRSLEELRQALMGEFPHLDVALADIQAVVTDLFQKGLLIGERTGQAEMLRHRTRKEQKQRRMRAFANLLSIRLPGWDPEPLLQRLYPLVSWCFSRWGVLAAATVVCSAWTMLLVQFDEFLARVPAFEQFFGWPNLIFLWLTVLAAKVVHEFGHGLSCRHFGSECHEMGVMLLVFTPCLYCDATDSWMLPDKWRRIAISAAGMYVEIVLSAIAFLVWRFTHPGLLHYLALNVFFVTTVTTVIFNLNPLMRLDGYYMLADFVEIPELRTQGEKLWRDKVAALCLGIEERPDPFLPPSGRAILLTYMPLAIVYRWFIVLGIAWFLYTVLKPYGLQSLGALLALVSVGGMLASMGLGVYRTIAAPRENPVSKTRFTLSCLVVALLVAAAALIPLPLHVYASCLLEPRGVQHVYVSTPGVLESLLAEPGQRVSPGQPLAQLSNVELVSRLQSLEVEQAVQLSRIDAYHAQENTAGESIARRELAGVRDQVAEVAIQIGKLRIVAPCDGTIVEPEFVAEPQREQPADPLVRWHGTPLHERNLGAALETRTHLLSIAPASDFTAVMLIHQADRNDIAERQEVEVRLDHLPDRTFRGRVESISRRQLEFAPGSLSNKLGGELPTVTDSTGRERLPEAVYQAAMTISEETHLLRPGLRGQARFLVSRHSLAGWIWRLLRQTFNFRL